jgi:5'-nucleotidase
MGGELHHTRDGAYEFATAERIVPHLAKRLASGDLGRDVLLNVNCPTGVPQGIRICKLGRRIWADQIELAEEHDGRRRFRLYSGDADYHRAPGTDFEAVADGSVAITALHVDWEHPEGTTLLAGLTGLLDDA